MLELGTDQLLEQLHLGVLLSPSDPKGSSSVSSPDSHSARSGMDPLLL